MKFFSSWRFVASVLLGAGLIFGGTASAQTRPPSQNQREYERLIYSVKGPDLYRAHCAACHGAEGKGNGPLAPALKALPADLTALSRNNKGEFPANRVRKYVSGDQLSASHGSREMPVWGPIFHQIEEDQDFGNVRLENLVKYLASIQQK